MPIKIPDSLPAAKTLIDENIFVITENRALSQDIRPIKILILNLMPTKIETETQILRLLGNTPLHLEVDLLQTATYQPKNISAEHLLTFYKTFDDIKNSYFDGLIITGAPVELMAFEDVDYWQELCTIMEWSKSHVYSSFHICWGAQAGLYYHYGIKKHCLNEKISGIFPHYSLMPSHPLMRGFDDLFWVPHSRYTSVCKEDILSHPKLDLLSYSDISGVHVVADRSCRQFFVTGHSEYDRKTLADEFERDRQKGMNIAAPANYFPENNPDELPPMTWRGHATLLFSNWVNLVYQHTPYDLTKLETM